jgi:hypothetical protein
LSKYLYTNESRFSPDTFFNAGAFVPDLADALTRETGERWTFTRKEDPESMTYHGPFRSCGVIRERDGLQLWIQRGPYNHPTRGEAAIDFKASGCGQYIDPATRHKATFAHNRDVKAVARQLVRSVIEPSAQAVAKYRSEQRDRDNTRADVRAKLARLAQIQGVKVSPGHSSDDTYVTIGGILFRVSDYGYINVERHSGPDFETLHDLAEFFASISRQLAA